MGWGLRNHKERIVLDTVEREKKKQKAKLSTQGQGGPKIESKLLLLEEIVLYAKEEFGDIGKGMTFKGGIGGKKHG